jgi:phosphoribosylformylglycinamidine cyclo-ligase
MDYRQAGVDIEAGRTFVDKIRGLVNDTHRPGVLGELGGFGGLFELPSGYRQPVLVSGTDGVGTKLKIAQACDRHDTVGIDLVAMCVNDVLTLGAEPLFFLDYLATGKLEPDQLAEVVKGISVGCKLAGCALLGGETAEMPGFYQPGEYDLAGFCVGIVDKELMLDGSQVKIGDAVVGLASSGIHSNGFSLVRNIIANQGWNWNEVVHPLNTPETSDRTLGEILLAPTRIYVKSVLSAIRSGLGIHGLAHITGGGLPENLPRCLGAGKSVELLSQSWQIPPVFNWLAQQGNVERLEMFNTFNMGIGMVAIVDSSQLEATLQYFSDQHLPASHIGWVVAGTGTVEGIV